MIEVPSDMLYLSREDIDAFADRILSRYLKSEFPNGHLYYNVDPIRLAQIYGFKVEYVNITRDGSILGQTSSGPIWTPIVDEDMNDMLYYLDGKTILVDKRLAANPKCVGRRNFTIAHELAHQFINRNYPEVYGPQYRTFYDFRRSAKPRKEIVDWYEWQADALAAAILLPREVVEEGMFWFGLGSKMKVLSQKYSAYKYDRFCEMAEFLQVSKTALSYRMEQLGLLEKNCLLKEAQARKGVA